MDQFERLVGIMARLRAEGGCPWDREQTHRSLRPYVIEEAHEVVHAIDQADDAKLREELGDLLLQIVFHAQLASEDRRFDIEDVSRGISDKLEHRHPHVFGTVEVDSSATVLRNWEEIKHQERQSKGESHGALAGVPRALSGLLRAQRIQEKAARRGFDWPLTDEVRSKALEEIDELGTALREESLDRVAQEMGDVLFALVNLCRHLGIFAEDALRESTEKFIRRFEAAESQWRESGEERPSLEVMEAAYQSAKATEREG